jgi:hypothetical protein
MKKIIVIAILGLMLASCKKFSKPSTMPELITASVNGTNFTINQQMGYTRSRLPNDSTEYFTLYGQDPSANYMGISLQSKHNLTTGVYKQTADSSTLLVVVFQQPGGDQYSTVYSVSDPSSFTITSIDSVSIKGTFSGIIYDNGDPGLGSRTITNGTFILSNP